MKLLTKTTLYFLAAIIPLLAMAGFYLFSRFSKEINNRSDKELLNTEAEWIAYIETQTDNGISFTLRTPDIAIYPTDASVAAFPAIADTKDFSEKQNRTISYRQLQQVVDIGGIPYLIIIRQSQEQKAALVTDITRIMLFVFAGLFAATLLFNWVISKQLWAPFRHSLSKIRSVELQKMEAVHFGETSTKEFNELNTSLNFMTNKMHRDYVNMKEFTENAAHEMQTPIAVAQSKLELLLQYRNLSEEQVESIMQATDVLSRLSKLNQGLLLLAKIENNQYATTETISLTEVTKKYLRLFDEFIKEKELTIKTSFEDAFTLKLHPLLADSLITNLLGNAIKYNYAKGSIEITITEDDYTISNTSHLPPIPSNKLFSRLNNQKGASENSNGLGLAIVKKIADVNKLVIDYVDSNDRHQFIIYKNRSIS